MKKRILTMALMVMTLVCAMTVGVGAVDVGTGAEGAPYVVSTQEELEVASDLALSGTTYIELGADITFANTVSGTMNTQLDIEADTVIDLAGYTLTLLEDSTGIIIYSGYSLTLTDSGSGGNGVIVPGTVSSVYGISNSGTLVIDCELTNAVSIVNQAESFAKITISENAVVNNSGIINNFSYCTLTINGIIHNTGSIASSSTCYINSGATVNNNSGGTLTNTSAYLYINSGATVNNNSGATLTNTGGLVFICTGSAFSNNGTLNNSNWICIDEGATVSNSGAVNNTGGFEYDYLPVPEEFGCVAYYVSPWYGVNYYEFYSTLSDAITDADGDEIIVIDSLTISENDTLEIPAGTTLTISEGVTITNNGTIQVYDNSGLTIAATIGGNIEIMTDITLTESINIYDGANITIEGNGHTITSQIVLEDTAGASNAVFIAEVGSEGDEGRQVDLTFNDIVFTVSTESPIIAAGYYTESLANITITNCTFNGTGAVKWIVHCTSIGEFVFDNNEINGDFTKALYLVAQNIETSTISVTNNYFQGSESTNTATAMTVNLFKDLQATATVNITDNTFENQKKVLSVDNCVTTGTFAITDNSFINCLYGFDLSTANDVNTGYDLSHNYFLDADGTVGYVKVLDSNSDTDDEYVYENNDNLSDLVFYPYYADAAMTTLVDADGTEITAPTISTISTSGGSGSVTIDWTVDNGNSPITAYVLTNVTTGESYAPATSATSYTISELTNGTAYSFTLTVTNAMGSASDTVTDTPYSSSSGNYTPSTSTTTTATTTTDSTDSTTDTTTSTTTDTTTSTTTDTTTTDTVTVETSTDTTTNSDGSVTTETVATATDSITGEVVATTTTETAVENSDGSVTTEIASTATNETTGETTVTTATATTTTADDGATVTETVATATNETTGDVTESVSTETVTDTATTVATVAQTTTSTGDVIAATTTVIADTATATEIVATVATENGETVTAELVAVATDDTTDVTIPQDVLTTVAAEETAVITVETPVATIELCEIATNTVAEAVTASEEVQVVISAVIVEQEVVSDAIVADLDNVVVVDLTVTVGGVTVSDFNGGTATVTIPYVAVNESAPITVYYVADDGSATLIDCTYDAENSVIIFETSHFSHYMISENTAVAFTDISVSAYYYDAVKWAVENGITSGYSDNTFRPTDACTRAQVVTFLWRAAGEPAVTADSASLALSDVDANAYYYDAVVWAVENGIATGYDDGTFRPDATCNRGAIVTFLYRFAGEPEVDGDAMSDVTPGAYYYDAVLWAVENGITTGYSDGTFGANDTCNRGQIVTFLYRYLAV